MWGPEDELLARIYIFSKLAHCGESVFFNAVLVGFFFSSSLPQNADDLSLHSLAPNQVFKETNQRKRVVAGSAPQMESSWEMRNPTERWEGDWSFAPRVQPGCSVLRLARLSGGTWPTEVHVNRCFSGTSSLPMLHFSSCPAQQALRRLHTPSWLPGIYCPQEGEEEGKKKKTTQLATWKRR